jgi:hypothetical protein
METQKRETMQDRLLKMMGYILIEPNHLGVVEANGRFAYFLPPGRHPPLNNWNTRLVAQIPTPMHLLDFTFTILSADRVNFTVDISVWCQFNPAKAARPHRANMATVAMGSDPASALRTIVGRATRYGLQKIIGTMSADALMQGSAVTTIERSVRHHLQTTLSDRGILCNTSSGVLIETLTPPPDVAEMQSVAYRRRKTAELLEHPRALQAHLLETLERQDNVFYMNGTGMRKAMEGLIEAAFAHTPSSSPPERWPQNGQNNGSTHREKEVIIEHQAD